MNRLQIWSDIPGQSFKSSTEGDAVDQADKKRKSGDTVQIEQVDSLDILIKLFARLCEDGKTWGSVNFQTHGGDGTVCLGSTTLDWKSYKQLENHDFARLFAAGCVITFDGCNVGEGSTGEYFLVEIGRTLLIAAGGSVRGSTGSGFGNVSGSESIHPFGEWVTANVASGASIRLENGTHLHSGHIEERLKSLHGMIESLDKGGALQSGEKAELEKAETNARNWGAWGDWYNRLQACLWLERAEERLFFISQRNHPKRPLGMPAYR